MRAGPAKASVPAKPPAPHRISRPTLGGSSRPCSGRVGTQVPRTGTECFERTVVRDTLMRGCATALRSCSSELPYFFNLDKDRQADTNATSQQRGDRVAARLQKIAPGPKTGGFSFPAICGCFLVGDAGFEPATSAV
jgi:hypothetical protein